MKLLSALLLLASCQDLGKRVIKGPQEHLGEDLAIPHAVILSAESKPFADEFPKAAKHWTPSWAEITRTQLLVDQEIKERLPSVYPRLASYHRQYAGYEVGKKKALLANFFCRAPEDWRTVSVQKEGRDGCYFSMKIDLSNNTVFGFTEYEADTHAESLEP